MSATIQNWVAMGHIKGVFGIKGWVKIAAHTEYTDSLLDYPEWRLNQNGRIRMVEIESGKVVNGELQAKFIGIDDRDEAFSLKGSIIEIARDAFEPTEENEYYWADLVGMKVINRENIDFGIVTKLMETGAHDVLEIQGNHGKKLIPFVEQYIDNVDTDTKTIHVDWGIDF